jgi:hypothetical protein
VPRGALSFALRHIEAGTFYNTNALSARGLRKMDRQVTHSGKDKQGDITKLCRPGQSWSPRSKVDAISDIELGLHKYFVQVASLGRVDIHVAKDEFGRKYLRTDPDQTKQNNLDFLPNC